MESAAGLPHPQPKTSRATSQLAGSNAHDGEPGRIPGTQERWRAWNSNALARFAAPGRSYRDVETPHSYGALTPGVQPKIWVKISQGERGDRKAVGEGFLRGRYIHSSVLLRHAGL